LIPQVEQPGRDFPRALGITIVLVTVTYLVPLAVATSLDAEHVRRGGRAARELRSDSQE